MLSLTHQIRCMKRFSRTFHFNSVLRFRMECTIEKRARMLTKLIKDKDKKKNWHLQLGSTGAPDQSIYDKVHKPHKRASVLNSLFMTNITDVLSTGDVCPEIMGHGVEITGVRVTSDYQIVNVYWQISNTAETPNRNLEIYLAKKAPDIRGELISRNVLGKVPRIFFIRDPTNKRAADFQKCLESSRVSEIKEPPSLPADDLVKDLMKFSDGRNSQKKIAVEEPGDPNAVEPRTAKAVAPALVPENPRDMKSDVMGLDHELIFNKVLAAKKKKANVIPQTSEVHHVVEDEGQFQKSDITYSIPVTPLRDCVDREKQMKKFCIDRKAEWAKMKKQKLEEICNTVPVDPPIEFDDETFEDDYFEEYEDMDDRSFQ